MKPKTLILSGFTLVEILIVLAILGLLASILFPVVAATRQRAQASACLSNLKQLGAANILYSQDYDGNYPSVLTFDIKEDGNHPQPGRFWYDQLRPYTKNQVFICPSRIVSVEEEKKDYTSGYAFNTELNESNIEANIQHFTGKNEALAQIQASTVLIFDVRAGLTGMDMPDKNNPPEGMFPRRMKEEITAMPLGATRHNGGANYAFLDGHTRWFLPKAFIHKCDGSKPCFLP